MRLLHTSDWHVGKAIRGHSRADEHRDVLAEIGDIAEAEAVDLTVVAGDLFDTAAPNPQSESIVYDALLRLAEAAPVIVIAGNHDSARRLEAVSRLLALGRITVASTPRAPNDGGVVDLVAAGTPVSVALLPFVSQRGIVRADALMDEAAFRNAQTYAERLRAVIAALSAGFSAEAVNLIVGHAFVAGGTVGGGERAAHLIDEYLVSAVDFPPTASYVALGHLHRAQSIPGPTAIHYCGSPLQLDFGETVDTKQVNLVEAEPGLPAKVSAKPLRSGRRLLTLTGTVEQLKATMDDDADAGLREAWLRVRVTEATRSGLADEVRAALGERVVDVRVEGSGVANQRRRQSNDGRTPSQLFTAYLEEREVEDPRLVTAFDRLHDEIHNPETAADELAVVERTLVEGAER